MQNISRVKGLRQEKIKDLMLFDRGYPSAELIMFLKQNNIKFLMRASAAFFWETRETKTHDENVEIRITK